MRQSYKDKKFVIIGGGIAGISMAVLLHRKGCEVVVCEREDSIPIRGNAFLMHSEGFSILRELAPAGASIQLPGKTIDTFILCRPDGTEIKYLKMEPWQCIKRKDIINFLYELLPRQLIRTNRQLTELVMEGDQVKSVVFKNGETETGDVFIGADGARSQMRQLLFGATGFSPVEVREIVGIARNSELIAENPTTFNKYLSGEKGLSFGYIPTSDEELVWFMQYDVRLYALEDEQPESVSKMCFELLADFPEVVSRVLRSSDFKDAYVWHATDFDLLPSFHRGNAVLIGDAAHLALPFTSAGTTNALIDARDLKKLILEKPDIPSAFNSFYRKRSPAVKEHLLLGRDIKHKFLNAGAEHLDEIKIPLITHQSTSKKTAPRYKKVHLLYFTDPVCSTCWTIQPQLRKLKMEYEDFLEIEYCMGGLLPSWATYNKGKIKSSEDAYNYWVSLSGAYDMPVNPDVWQSDPLASSYPPAIAFKAAQMQDTDKAVIFLRRLSELLFLEGVNITDRDLILDEAYEAGLDVARLKRDLVEKAEKLFEEDLKLVSELSIEVLPTFIFTDRFDKSVVLKGFQNYEAFEEVMKTFIPGLEKTEVRPGKGGVFDKFISLTTKEYAFLTDLEIDTAELALESMYQHGILEKQSVYGKEVMWRMANKKN
jgi:2-polyprenyl-6-methoxyphenol hydroxylase-like FAD-dependent oxidoreductase/predicted DsbA family dithiol-disulfide isomerase